MMLPSLFVSEVLSILPSWMNAGSLSVELLGISIDIMYGEMKKGDVLSLDIGLKKTSELKFLIPTTEFWIEVLKICLTIWTR